VRPWTEGPHLPPAAPQPRFRAARAALQLIKLHERAASLAREGLQQHACTAELEAVLRSGGWLVAAREGWLQPCPA
jgi:hypothetical protein